MSVVTSSVSYADVSAVRPGATLVAPWRTPFSEQHALVTLTVAPDGKSAEGRFSLPGRGPEPLRAEPPPTVDVTTLGDISSTRLTEAEFSTATFALGIKLRGVRQQADARRRYGRAIWLRGLDGDPSWACALFRAEPDLTTLVWQGGPRRLWDEAEAAYGWWVAQGAPSPARFGLTVDDAGGRLWLDEPGNVIREL
ncbi:hypothetical protein J7W19_13970 [Streptomyces mobaraensis NBRC 13819 = DSM 40847]|uniref:Protein-L-isoaspartate(D-aspartate) O-methyltransferase n=1 Tax=Streptomyces mobaraensis (strain ATCC 29032 / DSM 40847 / JCM 4168 / NBRC 13819 / NCIMB 11159 / IPCR 16-22) TaxID=1223523 RepID=M3C1W0_STRM1|nr:hypothetical protein [Streptomyces mobaraensis]EME97990.1 protein-L-isoaspartate(D-aspartate) O-methyltransferase [Streptomyces mobaraensis NBRC 13819 = DSM 40847]QTT74368.1 hypothetical protein J7W19_13970 [Streptomyces mobaraensis NBRC 13819 = DSM 40847]